MMSWPKKKAPLLPKTLAARAEKVPAEKVEAEVLRIVKAGPMPAVTEIRTPAFPPLEPGSLLPWPQYHQQALNQMQAAQAADQVRGMLQSSIFGSF